jgi:uroporphyrin-III C-methyltransferase
MRGIVYLVGAGPGDPGLITVRGHSLLRECDAIVRDRLVHPDLIPADTTAEVYYVGKCHGDATSWTQDAINALLITLARDGKRVVRLKGGDPFVFGRGGEEALALTQHGVPFEVVPGVTSGIAVPAYAGIPVTQRGVSASVTFVTANADPARINPPVDWRAVGRISGTLVLFMGAKTFASIAPLLVEGGRSPETPAAAVEWGTYDRQRTIVATVATLPAAIQDAELGAPVSIVIGDVVRLRDDLAWFDR